MPAALSTSPFKSTYRPRPNSGYRVYVEKGSVFEGPGGLSKKDITDDVANTILAVRHRDEVPWTKPDELEFDPDKDMTKLVGLVVNGKMQSAFFDGSVRTFAKIPAKASLNAYITRAGGEVIPDDDR